MADLPSSQLSALRERAEQATPGPWYAVQQESEHGSGRPGRAWLVKADGFGAVCGVMTTRIQTEHPTMEFIAACDPTTIKTLLDRLEALEQDRERLDVVERMSLTIHCSYCGGEQGWTVTDDNFDGDPITYYGKNARAAIDAARQAGPEGR